MSDFLKILNALGIIVGYLVSAAILFILIFGGKIEFKSKGFIPTVKELFRRE